MQDLKTWSKTHKKWVDAFVLEMRTLEAPGSAIGDQLLTVHSHCAETGEEPETSFVHPVEYARSLGYSPKTDTGEYARMLAPSLITLLAMFVFNYAISAIANEHNFMLNWAVLIAWGMCAVLAIILALIPYRILAGKTAFFMGIAIITSMLGIAGVLFSRFDWKLIVDIPALPVAIVSGIVMILAALVATRQILAEQDDIVTTPLQTEEEKQQDKRKGNAFGVAAAWILPVYSAISAIITLAF